jgi:hypothetical protein
MYSPNNLCTAYLSVAKGGFRINVFRFIFLVVLGRCHSYSLPLTVDPIIFDVIPETTLPK